MENGKRVLKISKFFEVFEANVSLEEYEVMIALTNDQLQSRIRSNFCNLPIIFLREINFAQYGV